jgi:hypothetical protein
MWPLREKRSAINLGTKIHARYRWGGFEQGAGIAGGAQLTSRDPDFAALETPNDLSDIEPVLSADLTFEGYLRTYQKRQPEPRRRVVQLYSARMTKA